MLSFIGRWSIVLARKGILHLEVILEGIRPEFGREICTSESTAKGVTNRLVCAFDWAILMRRVGTGRVDGVSEFIEEGANFGIMIKFTALVHVDVLVGSVLWRVAEEPGAEPSKGCRLGDSGCTVKGRGGVIGK
jgi:hypothetical protein